ncbi:Metastasis-associated protein MTA1 [Anabarilius grahami]|uniref:Metastasis-associated protein MTA1 n=1 Tax=Anabarilius grahami TaxID=495550 RepID=A0A3N0Y1M1_ANAGA|nr:Metastasis-associated protein MTA1 [Anabarilius grahami]
MGCNLPEVLARTGLRPGTPPSLRPAGDVPQSHYVYFENSSSNPLLIRRIEELNKTANGNVEAKVVCFYRRRDISTTLITLADKHARMVVHRMGVGYILSLPLEKAKGVKE